MTRAVVVITLLFTVEFQIAQCTFGVSFEIMSLEGSLRATELLMPDAHKVFDGISIQMFSACLLVGESEVADEIVGAHVFVMGPPMLFECIRGVKGELAVGAKDVFMLAGGV